MDIPASLMKPDLQLLDPKDTIPTNIDSSKISYLSEFLIPSTSFVSYLSHYSQMMGKWRSPQLPQPPDCGHGCNQWPSMDDRRNSNPTQPVSHLPVASLYTQSEMPTECKPGSATMPLSASKGTNPGSLKHTTHPSDPRPLCGSSRKVMAMLRWRAVKYEEIQSRAPDTSTLQERTLRSS